MGEGEARSCLLRLLFRGPGGFREEACAVWIVGKRIRDAHLHVEALVVVGPGLGGQDIERLTAPSGL